MEHSSSPKSWLLQIPGLPTEENWIHVNGAVLVFLGIVGFAWAAKRGLGKNWEVQVIPSARLSFVSLVDALMELLMGMVENTLGPKAKDYFPFIASLFLYVWFSNLIGLLPFGAAPTSNVNTTFALGIAAFVYYNYMGVKEHGVVGYLKHFLMGLGPVGVLVALLEIVSQCIRPLSLGIRLFVNMHVDHTVVLSFQNLFAWLLPIPLLLFGIVVCTIQAFVFATLTAVYVQMATEHEASHADGH